VLQKALLTQEAAEAKFQVWLTEKTSKITSKINQKAQASKTEIEKRLEAEAKVKEDREQALAAKRAKSLEKEAKLEASQEEVKNEEPVQEPEQQVSEEPKTDAIVVSLKMKKEDCFQLGYISKTHGFKGEVIFLSNGKTSIKLNKLESVFIEINGQLIPFFIESLKQATATSEIIKFCDIDTEEKARQLIKCNIYILSSLIPKQNEDNFNPF